MAIIKATYTKRKSSAKASIRYIEHRSGKDGSRASRTLFNSDGALGRWQAYNMVDQAETGSIFFRFIISPDPKVEDTKHDLHLRAITEQTMQTLEDRLQKALAWVATEHSDHTPHRHVHIVAVVPGRLYPQDFQRLRESATQACLQQRQERDLMREHQRSQRKGEEWERSY